MDRSRPLVARSLFVVYLGALLVASGGCATGIATALYVLRGNMVPAEYEGLKEQRVVVVCRAPASMPLELATVPKDLARQISNKLSVNVKKVVVVEQQEVDAWMDENSWDDFKEVGRALKADQVVAVDLMSFSTDLDHTLLQGKAEYSLHVYDMTNNGAVVFEKYPKPSQFPPNTAYSTLEKQKHVFRREYIAILADEIGRHFYPYDANASFALDSTTLR